jgi:hypothetical protein
VADANKLLAIYLNDHLAGATAGIELLKRTLSSNKNTEFGAFCERLVPEIEADCRQLQDVMTALGVTAQEWKRKLAWAAEKVARLKLNGQITGYSDLSRVLEIEGLCVGVEGKLFLWRALGRIAPGEPRLVTFDFEELADRARRQRDELETHRLAAIDKMMSPV